MQAPEDLHNTDAALDTLARTVAPCMRDATLAHLCEEQPARLNALHARVESSWLRVRERYARTWFESAHWTADAPGTFVFRQREFPAWTIELEFFFEGQALLTQRFAGEEVDWPIEHAGRKIAFTRGMADISLDLASAIAAQTGLPEPFGNWDDARVLRRSLPPLGGALTSAQRKLLDRLAAVGAEFGQSFAVLASWLFPQPLAVRGEHAVPPTAIPVVVAMEALGDGEMRVGLRWTAAPAKPVERITVAMDGNPVSATASLDTTMGELRLQGFRPPPDVLVTCRWDDDAGVLQLRFATA